MREIKFRAWDTERYIFRVLCDRNWYDSPEIHAKLVCQAMPNDARKWTIEQFTGLRDKNGREIYEGDILQCGIHPMYIELNEEFGQWYASDMDDAYHTPLWVCLRDNNAVLTGNIHQNPELLGGDSQ